MLLRLDPKIHTALQKWAADEFRSVNAQIEFLLRQALRQAGRLNGGDPGAGQVERAGQDEDSDPGPEAARVEDSDPDPDAARVKGSDPGPDAARVKDSGRDAGTVRAERADPGKGAAREDR